jgi:proline-specific peptidase
MSSNAPTITEGTIPFEVEGETFQTWYKIVGDLTTRTRTPLVALHGGPGLSHDYLIPLGDLANSNIPVIFYDQLGNARSTHLRDKPKSFWTIDLFIDELVNLLTHFNILDDFDLICHSWGGIMGAEFEVRRQPAGLKHLILTNSLASTSLWNESNAQLVKTFPQDVEEGLKAGMSDLERYHDALLQFHAVHGCIIKPPPQEYVYSLDRIFGKDGDPTVAMGMYVLNRFIPL